MFCEGAFPRDRLTVGSEGRTETEVLFILRRKTLTLCAAAR